MCIYIHIHIQRKEMDDEMMEFSEDFLEPTDFDWEYEFDAPHFFDFTRIETEPEAQEVDRWFRIAGCYPPSPLVAKLLMKKAALENMDAVSTPENGAKMNSISKNVNIASCSDACDAKEGDSDTEDEGKSVSKSSISRISTLMKPTVSHLAKLSKARDTHSSCICGRARNASLHKNGKCFQNSPVSDYGASKRQKLEIGYLRKVAQLKHQNSLLHKFSKKVTIPKEPELETLQRAHTRRSRTSSNCSEHTESKSHTFKARPLNTKILQAPTLLPPKRTRIKQPDFQEFHLKTTERAMLNSSANDMSTNDADSSVQRGVAEFRRPNSANTLKDKCQTPKNSKTRSLNAKIFPAKEDLDRTDNTKREVTMSKESKFTKDEKVSPVPPTDLFEKLSLRCESDKDKVSHRKSTGLTKGSKENNPHQLETELLKPKQCGSGYLFRSNLNRSQGIR